MLIQAASVPDKLRSVHVSAAAATIAAASCYQQGLQDTMIATIADQHAARVHLAPISVIWNQSYVLHVAVQDRDQQGAASPLQS